MTANDLLELLNWGMSKGHREAMSRSSQFTANCAEGRPFFGRSSTEGQLQEAFD